MIQAGSWEMEIARKTVAAKNLPDRKRHGQRRPAAKGRKDARMAAP